MKNYTTENLFIKWFIIFAVILSIAAIAGYLGFFSLLLASDISHLSQLIGLLFMGSSLLTGKLSYDISRNTVDSVTIRRRLKVLDFISGIFMYIGLLGTIVGFCYMMHGTLGGGNLDVTQIIQQLKIGSSTKLYTTLSGIIASILLQVQVVLVKVNLIGTYQEVEDENN